MEETNNIYIPDNRQLFSASKTGLFWNSLRPLSSDYQEKGKDETIIEKNLPADHLTATYWG
ncbi:MAG TPA: hypothetical protein VMT12_00510 [Syntrophales bacterium]|nr:hypothetical protein [Syntrophales bacterium]